MGSCARAAIRPGTGCQRAENTAPTPSSPPPTSRSGFSVLLDAPPRAATCGDVTPNRNSTQKPRPFGARRSQTELDEVNVRLVVGEAAGELVLERDRDGPQREAQRQRAARRRVPVAGAAVAG